MRIVLVDPSRTVLKYVARMLETREHQASPFTSAGEALEYISSHPEVDALIASLELGATSGLELCWQARLLARSDQPLYIILMSSMNNPHMLSEALDSGADDFIGKPPNSEELYARLRAAEHIGLMQRELIRFATTDSLTGLLNRRVFFERANEAATRTRERGSLSAIMADIDHFKRINDTFGHDVGDKVIRAVAGQLKTAGGIVGRLGGEEFALLYEGVSLAQVANVAEQIRRSVESLEFAIPGHDVKAQCSFGVSTQEPSDSVDQFLKRADVALYAAKLAGRNRVIVDGSAGRKQSVIRTRLA